MPNKDQLSLQLEIMGIDDAIEVLQTYRAGLQERYEHLNGIAPAPAKPLGRRRKQPAPIASAQTSKQAQYWARLSPKQRKAEVARRMAKKKRTQAAKALTAGA